MQAVAQTPPRSRGGPPAMTGAGSGRPGSTAACRCLRNCFRLLAGLLLSAATLAAAAEFGLQLRDTSDASGAEVAAVTAGSSAATAGIQPGDIVRRLEQTPIGGAAQFSRRARSVPAGEPVTLRISRQGWERDIVLPPEAARPAPARRFGLRLAEPPAGTQPTGSVAIAAVLANTAAAEAGLQPGDIVTQVDGHHPGGASGLVHLLQEAAAANRPLRLVVRRDGWEKEALLSAAAPASALTTAEWNAADQLVATAAAAPAATSRSAADRAAGAPAADTAAAAQARAELLAMDEAGSRAYRTDLEMGDAAYEGGRWQDAARHYRQATARVPSEVQSWARLGHTLLMQQRHADAVRACRRALDLGGPRAETLNNLALAYAGLGALAQARDAYLRAIETAPEWPLPYAGLALVHYTRQDWPAAEKYYRLALERDPGNADHHQMLQVLRQRQGEATTASPATAAPVAARPGAAPIQPTVPPAPTAAGAEPAARPPVPSSGAPPAEAMPMGRKTTLAIGEFMVKAAGAGQFIGDGLREMMMTTMHENGRFIVVERLDLQGLAAEQALSRSPLARPDAIIAERQMDVAEIMVSAAVTEFELEASGGGLELGVPRIPLTFGHQSRNAHVAIDVRVIDIATGRVLASKRIEGRASASQTSIGATLSRRGTAIPVSLGAFRNTPMEAAIRDCVQQASEYITSSTPKKYFRHD
ncbi:CsgG/HfaB family protein [Accumulibacter sp.]|uniref:CsgG/HfaB family protein n=1 Tax=Accumulibacter sp. TaxID=2053492 RepID=UPI0025CE834E|nr:CsgG/HfaB family protein [Accumulibacter sp.]MCM8611413.1 PDZ domain-containing protein [Accumulibacter sp.]MCM8634940.1 PDZ domain-containing protein [Accumulibacter sp.]MCM8638541.1 PDZ domain-containing protein [Accumulibacter sp.]